MSDTLALARLLQLASPALPVGAYAYSQGLEWVADGAGIVRDEAGAGEWIAAVMQASVASFELPLLARLMDAWQAADTARARELNEIFLASRETAELRMETVQMGRSLARLLAELGGERPGHLPDGFDEPAFPAVWSYAACRWDIPPPDALAGYLWAWLENQVMAAVKIVPLGQSAGQRLLARLAEAIPAQVEGALALDEDEWSNFAPMLAIAGSLHETQYTRLFRS